MSKPVGYIADHLRRVLINGASAPHTEEVQRFFKDEIQSRGWYTNELRKLARRFTRVIRGEEGLDYLVQVADNMQRAMQALDAELREKAEPGVKALLDGVELTERELLNVLEKHGVKKSEPTGEKFDPNFHQAMFEVPDSKVPSGTVVQVVQPGYTIGERVLRPALVAIAKGGPKPAPANDNAGAEGSQGN